MFNPVLTQMQAVAIHDRVTQSGPPPSSGPFPVTHQKETTIACSVIDNP
jgi:hypothetical protein